jgi:excisionase family DNA binding protein
MGKRIPNHRLVKIHRNYTVEETAKLFGIHKNTVRRWVKEEGLAAIDDKRPMLILGHVLAEFLKVRRTKNKQKCKPGELYCVRCRVPKLPAGDMAEYSSITEKFGNLIGICPDCDSIMNRRVSMSRIGEFDGIIDISFTEAVSHLDESPKLTVNSDLRQEISDHEKV